MKKQDSLQALALAPAEMCSVKGGAYKVSFQRPDGSHGFVVIDVIDGTRIGGNVPGTFDVVTDIANGY